MPFANGSNGGETGSTNMMQIIHMCRLATIWIAMNCIWFSLSEFLMLTPDEMVTCSNPEGHD